MKVPGLYYVLNVLKRNQIRHVHLFSSTFFLFLFFIVLHKYPPKRLVTITVKGNLHFIAFTFFFLEQQDRQTGTPIFQMLY